jgi:hypothetical protein
MINMKKILTILSLSLVPNLVFAQAFNNIGELLVAVIELLLGLGGVVAMIGIIVGGYKYIASGGNPEMAEQGKAALLYSIIGLVVILISVIFVRFLMAQLGVTDLRIFGLG